MPRALSATSICYAFIIALLLATRSVAAAPAAAPAQDPLEVSKASQKPEDPYQRDYISLGIQRNFPEAYGDQFLETYKPNPYVGYTHTVNGKWLMGFFAEFKMFTSVNRKPDTLNIWTLGHEVLWSWRAYHPFYLVAGPQILYLMPVETAEFPLRRSGEQPSEIGVGAAAGLTYVGSSRFLFSFLADRWRGTATQRLQGSELKFIISWAPFTY